jgi:lysophospholipase L1-like esterase
MGFWTRFVPAALLATAVVGAVTAYPAAASSYRQQATDYYLALGDSLSVGIQPDQDGVEVPTDVGYVDDVSTDLNHGKSAHGADLTLVKLGCSGETSTTMINGGICTYPHAGSQLAAATQFLAAHQGHVALVTFNIGSNDVAGCVTAAGADLTCVAQGLAALQANLATITAGLSQADPGVRTRFVGLNYYDPFLADWLQGTDGQQFATESVGLVDELNQVLAAGYGQAGYAVADVATAFQITAFTPTVTLPGVGAVPVNVADTCELTWMCAPAPVGPNIHPNAGGYAVIARAVEAVL